MGKRGGGKPINYIPFKKSSTLSLCGCYGHGYGRAAPRRRFWYKAAAAAAAKVC